MKILFLAPYVPSRIRVRPFQIINELAKRHEVHVVALAETGGTHFEGARELMEIAADVKIIPHSKLKGYSQSLMALPTPYPMCTAFCWSGEMQRAVKEKLDSVDFDVVHVEHIRAAHFAPEFSQLPVIFDAVDCLTGLFQQMSHSLPSRIGRMIHAEEAWKLKRYEPKLIKRFDKTIITSESEREELLQLDPSLDVSVIPNGVDVDYFAPLGSEKMPKRIVFSGKMSYHPNESAVLWFADRCFPVIKQKYPEAEFLIVGSEPPAEVKKLAGVPGISVTGYVNDIRPYLDSSSVAVVPMQVAVGIQNKVLEAMAMGLPVVASPVAVRPFGRSCPGILEAVTDEDTTNEVLRLLENSEEAAEIGRRGREEVIQRFSWRHNVGVLESMYESAIAAQRARV